MELDKKYFQGFLIDSRKGNQALRDQISKNSEEEEDRLKSLAKMEFSKEFYDRKEKAEMRRSQALDSSKFLASSDFKKLSVNLEDWEKQKPLLSEKAIKEIVSYERTRAAERASSILHSK